MCSTIEYVRKLPSYKVRKTEAPYDAFVYNILTQRIPQAIPILLEYSRGLYDLSLHLNNFQQFNRTMKQEKRIHKLLSNSRDITLARTLVEEQLRPLFTIDAIPMNQLDRIDYVKSSSAGYGYTGSKSDNYLLARSRATTNLVNFNRFKPFRFTPYKAFARPQLAPRSVPKIRHVWGSPFHTILIEGTIAQPIIDKCLNNDSPIFIGRDMFKDIPNAIHQLLGDDNFAYCIDFSGFDASVNSWFIESFFDFLRTTVNFLDEFSASALSYSREQLLHTPIVLPNGKLYLVHTGIPSGSFFTQLLGSYTNLVLMTAAQLHIFHKRTATYVLGDDSIFASTDGSKLNEFTVYLRQFGFTVNVTKSLVSNNLLDVQFLGHNVYGSRLTRDDFTLALLALHTEEEHNDIKLTILRIRSLLYDSGHNSFLIMNLLTDLLMLHSLPCNYLCPYIDLFLLS